MYRAWICISCRSPQRMLDNIWVCPGCQQEACDSCAWVYGHCKSCCKGKTREELRLAANATGMFDFDPSENDHLPAI